MKDIFFHQIVKYTYAKQGIEAMRTQEKHRILEIGADSCSNLGEYLPDDTIMYLDVTSLDMAQADAGSYKEDILYEDEYFDFVVILDALESVKEDKRLDFIKTINRIAKIGIILSSLNCFVNDSFEGELLKYFYKLSGQPMPLWFDKHKDYPHLDKDAIVMLLEKAEVNDNCILSYYGIKRDLLIKISLLEIMASQTEACSNFFDIMDSDYLHSILYQDIGLPADLSARIYVIWTKNNSIGKAKKQFCQDSQSMRKAIDSFEEKHLELMKWGLINLDYFKKIGNTKFGKKKLNVVLVTYNQAKFIRQTLESVLNQQTVFNYNIIVADDCSTDDTVSIIKQMEQQTEIPFVYLPNDHNLGIMQNYKRAFEVCDAEYIAIMEGDDLWTDKLRLQKHIYFLDGHWECAMSFNQYVVKNFEEGTAFIQPKFPDSKDKKYFKYLDGHDLAYTNYIGNFSTCVYRSSVLKSLPEQMFSMKGYDWLTNIMVSRMGYVACLIQPMSIYRVHSHGTWSSQNDKEKNLAIIEAIEIYDEYTDKEFTSEFAAHKLRLRMQLQTGKLYKIKAIIKNVIRGCYKISFYLPSIFVHIIKLLMPPVILDIVSETCER